MPHIYSKTRPRQITNLATHRHFLQRPLSGPSAPPALSETVPPQCQPTGARCDDPLPTADLPPLPLCYVCQKDIHGKQELIRYINEGEKYNHSLISPEDGSSNPQTPGLSSESQDLPSPPASKVIPVAEVSQDPPVEPIINDEEQGPEVKMVLSESGARLLIVSWPEPQASQETPGQEEEGRPAYIVSWSGPQASQETPVQEGETPVQEEEGWPASQETTPVATPQPEPEIRRSTSFSLFDWAGSVSSMSESDL